MALTNFVDGSSLIKAAWLNGVDQAINGVGTSLQGAGLIPYTHGNVGGQPPAPAGSVGAALDSLTSTVALSIQTATGEFAQPGSNTANTYEGLNSQSFATSLTGNVSGGTPLPVFGTAFCFQELWTTSTNTEFGWTGGSQNYAAPFLLGSSANAGGFYVEIYAGIGRFNSSANPGFFIGLCLNPIVTSFGGAGTHFWSGSSNMNGILVDTVSGGSLANWSTVQQNGSGAPVITPISPALTPAGGQLFCVRLQALANSNTITLDVSQLTALGVWTPIVTAMSLTSSPAGTRLAPVVTGITNTSGGAANGVFLHRIFGLTDQYAVPKAF